MGYFSFSGQQFDSILLCEYLNYLFWKKTFPDRIKSKNLKSYSQTNNCDSDKTKATFDQHSRFWGFLCVCVGCTVVLYQHCGFRGYKHVYTGSKPTVNRGANDQYSSAKLVNCGNKQVTLYQHGGFKGRSWTLRGSGDSCFVDNGFNDIVCQKSNSRPLSHGFWLCSQSGIEYSDFQSWVKL